MMGQVARPARIALCALVALATLLAAACDRKPESKLPRYDRIGGSFTLMGQNGNAVSLRDFRGKAMLMFFGFTNCRDICPTTMLTLKRVHGKLGPEAERLQVIFVSLDPERDRPAKLVEYVHQFDKSFLGLTGSLEQVREVAKNYAVFFKKGNGSREPGQLITHSDVLFLIDQQGTTRALYRTTDPMEKILTDAKGLLN